MASAAPASAPAAAPSTELEVRVSFAVVPNGGDDPLSTSSVAVEFAVIPKPGGGRVNKKRRDREKEFLQLDKKDNGTLRLESGVEFTIPLWFDELLYSGTVASLPNISSLSFEESTLLMDVNDAFLEKFRHLIKKKRARRSSMAAVSRFRVTAQAPGPTRPPPELTSDEVKAFLRDNEETLLRNGFRRILKTELAKSQRTFCIIHKKQQVDIKRLADLSTKEMKTRFIRMQRECAVRGTQRMRRVSREMMLYWKKMERESAQEKKIADKEAAEARRKAEEERESKRKQQQLNFLLTQTELYAHFMADKIGVKQKDPLATQVAKINELDGEEQDEALAMHAQATEMAKATVAHTMEAKEAFDKDTEQMRVGESSTSMLQPSTMPQDSRVGQPRGLVGHLKSYQIKGLQWLVNIYDQGLNGILADEMGLGKTVQAISFLAHLAEDKNIWGPFLVVAPGSTLHNWDREIQSFFPKFKVLPYWGNKVQRRDIRPCIHPKKLYSASGHHVVVTSYDIVLKDELQLKRVKWQYMVLDEAQAIKNADSFRWKILLSFSCRNRLLLTGTPIQNNMAELWALLHFIMPTLFNSHDQFNEWFSKGIEGHAEGTQDLNEHQLNRLKAVLQPFMLRRVKKDVENDMPPKKEVTLKCALTKRQKELYRRVRNKISIVDLFKGGSKLNTKADEGKVQNLMNIVMQLRKVCNHPELFHEQEEKTPFHFAHVNQSLESAAWGQLDWAWCLGRQAGVTFSVPKLVYEEGMGLLPTRRAEHRTHAFQTLAYHKLNVFDPINVHASVMDGSGAPGVSFLRMIGMTPSDVNWASMADALHAWVYMRGISKAVQRVGEYLAEQGAAPKSSSMLVMAPTLSRACYRVPPTHAYGGDGVPLVQKHLRRLMGNAALIRILGRHIDAVRAPPPELLCSSARFANARKRELACEWEHALLYGFANHQVKHWKSDPSSPQEGEGRAFLRYHLPLLTPVTRALGSGMPVKFYALAKALADSGKLQVLDDLLRRLKGEGRRVLLFCQMTQMMNLLEDYLNFRKYKFLRLDGSTKIEDRRDMVDAFQTQDDIFMFLLSTRAGGLGINLVAADTVVFYESDWNPTMDQQAMDRCHRIGQTKLVTIYRLVCGHTIEEKIIKRASQKGKVQQLVIGGSSQANVANDVLENDEVVDLLKEEDDE